MVRSSGLNSLRLFKCTMFILLVIMLMAKYTAATVRCSEETHKDCNNEPFNERDLEVLFPIRGHAKRAPFYCKLFKEEKKKTTRSSVIF